MNTIALLTALAIAGAAVTIYSIHDGPSVVNRLTNPGSMVVIDTLPPILPVFLDDD